MKRLRTLHGSLFWPFFAALVMLTLILVFRNDKASQDENMIIWTGVITDPIGKTVPKSPTDGPSSALRTTTKQVKDDCIIRPYNFEGASQTDPKLIDYIRKELLRPPSPHRYNLRRPNVQDHSQFGQSKYADETYLHGMRDGFFIEAGGVDGEYLSNSLYFEKELGWRGLLVEPIPDSYEKLVKRNRKAYSANAALAITTNASKVTLRKGGSVGEMSQLSAKGTFKVTAIPLFSLLLALDVKVVDFLSLDIESSEVKVLKTIPWDNVIFRLMCIEVNHIPEGFQYLNKYLVEKGYKFLGKRDVDAWYGLPSLLNKTREH